MCSTGLPVTCRGSHLILVSSYLILVDSRLLTSYYLYPILFLWYLLLFYWYRSVLHCSDPWAGVLYAPICSLDSRNYNL